MGRPSEYTPEILEKARQYLTEFGPNLAPMEEFEASGDVIPTVAGLALRLEVSRDTVYEWAKHEDKQEFSDIYKQIMAAQENTLVQSGLRGDFNPTITKLMLSKHGYIERQDITSDGKALPQPILGIPQDEK